MTASRKSITRLHEVGKLIKQNRGGVIIETGSECWAGTGRGLYLLDRIGVGLPDHALKKIMSIDDDIKNPIELKRLDADINAPFLLRSYPDYPCKRFYGVNIGQYTPILRQGGAVLCG